jgi:predicted GNAT family acetyltransferase
MLGVARATAEPAPGAYWALVLHDGEVVAAALRTETRLILSREGAPGAMALFAADAASPKIRRILGPPDSVERFAAASEQSWSQVMLQCIYECRAVTSPKRVSGVRRVAQSADREMLAVWGQRLSAEALSQEVTDTTALARVSNHIAHGAMHIWDDDRRPVSVAAAVAPTPHGIRINNVYTPPEYRGRGYAGALVASLTEAMLQSDREFTFLHTDLSNPTSKRLYVRIGYRHVADFRVAQLDGASAATTFDADERGPARGQRAAEGG